ncbi:DUF3757 domain-containing protein [Yersinia pseudotuberculosis]|uniref:DUF3757 domain-containing protein n=1 Tax=Yersinia pseudotuberculosis TaxID=633 RepID=UPI001A9D6ADE|nr:DUF3757 domain-containing protein [Yersinia pseudotuberculosis]MBO1631319.1 DUF3757 domain-containing protein [Yersinia pseudotuberculosis]MBP0070794.1 DUF3757 domain-containing protein [Yersinia pseudotuberculosis]
MKKSMLFLSLILSAPYIMANELSSCPNKSEISYQQGVYTTPDGKWLGVSVGVENSGDVRHFLYVKYIPYNAFNMDIGRLNNCTYALASGSVDMYFYDERALALEGVFVSLMGHMFWEKTTTSGKESYIFTASSVNDCTFTRLDDDVVDDYKNRQ